MVIDLTVDGEGEPAIVADDRLRSGVLFVNPCSCGKAAIPIPTMLNRSCTRTANEVRKRVARLNSTHSSYLRPNCHLSKVSDTAPIIGAGSYTLQSGPRCRTLRRSVCLIYALMAMAQWPRKY